MFKPSSREPLYKRERDKDEPRSNTEITVYEVRLIGANGENVGVVTTREALRMAREAKMDLVEISPGVMPPVCKILDLGRYKYDLQKRKNELKKKQKTTEVKELRMSPNIGGNDYDVRLKAARKFLSEGDKVKFSLKFKGREMAYQDLGMKVMQRVIADLGDSIKVEAAPKTEGRQMMMIVAPVGNQKSEAGSQKSDS